MGFTYENEVIDERNELSVSEIESLLTKNNGQGSNDRTEEVTEEKSNHSLPVLPVIIGSMIVIIVLTMVSGYKKKTNKEE